VDRRVYRRVDWRVYRRLAAVVTAIIAGLTRPTRMLLLTRLSHLGQRLTLKIFLFIHDLPNAVANIGQVQDNPVAGGEEHA